MIHNVIEPKKEVEWKAGGAAQARVLGPTLPPAGFFLDLETEHNQGSANAGPEGTGSLGLRLRVWAAVKMETVFSMYSKIAPKKTIFSIYNRSYISFPPTFSSWGHLAVCVYSVRAERMGEK